MQNLVPQPTEIFEKTARQCLAEQQYAAYKAYIQEILITLAEQLNDDDWDGSEIIPAMTHSVKLHTPTTQAPTSSAPKLYHGTHKPTSQAEAKEASSTPAHKRITHIDFGINDEPKDIREALNYLEYLYDVAEGYIDEDYDPEHDYMFDGDDESDADEGNKAPWEVW